VPKIETGIDSTGPKSPYFKQETSHARSSQFRQRSGRWCRAGRIRPSPVAVLMQGSGPLEQVRILYGFPAGSAGLGGSPGGRKNGQQQLRKNMVWWKTSPALVAASRWRACNSVEDGSVIALSQVSAFSIYPHIYSKLTYQARISSRSPSAPSCTTDWRSAPPCRSRSRRSRTFWPGARTTPTRPASAAPVPQQPHR
jgi:hypothetical protein